MVSCSSAHKQRSLRVRIQPEAAGVLGGATPADTANRVASEAGGAGGIGLSRGQARWDGRRVRLRILIALDQGTAETPASCWYVSDQRHNLSVFATQTARVRAATRPFAPHNNPRVVEELHR